MGRKIIGATVGLKKFLQQSPDLFDMMMRGINAIVADYHAAKSKGFSGKDVAHTFQGLVDKEVARALSEDRGEKPICQRGCAFCCYQNVDITIEEAELLVDWAAHKKIPIDWSKAKRQAEAPDWKKMAYSEKRCVFLNSDNECSVYEHR